MSSELLKDLALANHILVNEGVLDGFGHISVRNPANPQRFFIARDRKSTRLNSSHIPLSRMPSSA